MLEYVARRSVDTTVIFKIEMCLLFGSLLFTFIVVPIMQSSLIRRLLRAAKGVRDLFYPAMGLDGSVGFGVGLYLLMGWGATSIFEDGSMHGSTLQTDSAFTHRAAPCWGGGLV